MRPVLLGTINHKSLVLKSRYRGKKADFSTVFTTLFCPPGKIPGTNYQIHPEALPTLMDACVAELVILPSAITAQEERPFQTPLLASAHRSPCSGTLWSGRFPSEGFCWAHSFFAASSRSRMEGFPWGSSRRPLLITPSIIP